VGFTMVMGCGAASVDGAAPRARTVRYLLTSLATIAMYLIGTYGGQQESWTRVGYACSQCRKSAEIGRCVTFRVGPELVSNRYEPVSNVVGTSQQTRWSYDVAPWLPRT
jgi:hypothetical protein